MVCILKQAAAKFPDNLALKTDSTGISYRVLDECVNSAANYLIDLGAIKNSRIAILANNSITALVFYFAIHRLGATAVMLNLRLTVNDWKQQIYLTATRLVLADDQYADQLLVSGIKIIRTSTFASALEEHRHSIEVLPEKDPDQEAVIIFTSGSSGHSKGVLLSLNNFIESASASNLITGLNSDDCWALSLPIYHAGGLGIIYRSLLAGSCSLLVDSFSVTSLLSYLKQDKFNIISVVPTVLQELIDACLEDNSKLLNRLRLIVLAGAPSAPKLLSQIVSLDLNVMSAWGMTETTAHCTCTLPNDSIDQITTVGRPFHHTQLRIVDENGQDTEIGEILVKGPTVCLGYLAGSAEALPSRNGWLHTGDFGQIDAAGNLKILGRLDSMIISGGENIHASEIESVASSCPEVRVAAVVPRADSKWGQRPVLFIEPASTAFDRAKLDNLLEAKLARIKRPDSIFVLKSLPRTAIGKIDYPSLKALLPK